MNRLLSYSCLLIALLPLTTELEGARPSLYRVDRSPFAARTAHKVGDLVTIILMGEELSVTGEGANQTNKSSNFNFSITDLFLPSGKINNAFFRQLFDKDKSPTAKGSESGSAGGSGKLENSYTFETGKIQGKIVDVINEDQFVVQARRSIKINGKEKTVYVSGVIRKDDIEKENTIESIKIAEASLEIDGEMVSEDLQPSIFTRILQAIF